jgi:hypothetical protein
MALWRDHLLPRIVDKTCGRHDLAEHRRRALSGLRGDVVEIGFGSGHNLPHYPADVDVVLAVEPALVAQRLAEPRVAASTVPVTYVGLDGQDLALPCDPADGCTSSNTASPPIRGSPPGSTG